MRPFATLQRARAHRLAGPARAEARALLVDALHRLRAGDIEAASLRLDAAHEQVRNSVVLHTGVHLAGVAVGLRRRASGQRVALDLPPLLLAGVSSWLRRAAGVAPDAPAGDGLWETWQARPREG